MKIIILAVVIGCVLWLHHKPIEPIPSEPQLTGCSYTWEPSTTETFTCLETEQ